MRTNFASTTILTRTARWLMAVWCMCFLGASLVAPASAAIISIADKTEVVMDTFGHASSNAPSMAMNHHQQSNTAYGCDNDACVQPMGCPNICVHCSVCGFSAASASAVTNLGDPLLCSGESYQRHSDGLPMNRPNPPFRPPIVHH